MIVSIAIVSFLMTIIIDKFLVNKVSKKYKLYTYYIEVNLLNDEERQGLKNIISYDGTPTTVFIFDGTEKTAANRLDGSVSEEKIIAKLKSNGFIE